MRDDNLTGKMAAIRFLTSQSHVLSGVFKAKFSKITQKITWNRRRPSPHVPTKFHKWSSNEEIDLLLLTTNSTIKDECKQPEIQTWAGKLKYFDGFQKCHRCWGKMFLKMSPKAWTISRIRIMNMWQHGCNFVKLFAHTILNCKANLIWISHF